MTHSIGALLIVVAIQVAAIVGLLVQRTRRSRAERALRESEEWLRDMVEGTPAMLWTARPDTLCDYFNTRSMEFTGKTLEQLLGEGWVDGVHPDDWDRCMSIFVPAFEARKAWRMEYRIGSADGSYRWIVDTALPRFEKDGTFAGYYGCSIDITDRVEADERIRESRAALEVSHREIQHLAGRLIEAQDAERARVARDLHDDVSQQLAGLSIAFSGLRQQVGELQGGASVQDALRSLQQRTSTIAQSVRHLSHDLHPTVLRHAGLVAALQSYCAELERIHGTAMACHAEGDFGSITEESALCVYRVAQEALRNVIAHAGASRADLRLLRMGDIAEMTIVDNGKGFDFEGVIQRGKGLGLVSISERVRLVGGTVSVVTEPKKGTRLSIQVPANGHVKAVSDAGADIGVNPAAGGFDNNPARDI